MKASLGVLIVLMSALMQAVPMGLFAQNTENGTQVVSPGVWAGTLSIRKGGSQNPPGSQASDTLTAPITLRLLKSGSGGLLDIPSQSMFGYPLDDVTWTAARLRFSLDALGPGEEMKFDGFLSSSGSQAGSIIGTATAASWRGSFVLARDSSGGKKRGISVNIPIEEGILPGTLELPRGSASGVPLVILISGAGASDRDGNNYNVPGRTDTMALLAAGLSGRGVASFRFDRRGAGEAYAQEAPGRQTSLDTHARDVIRIIEHFSREGTYSRIVAAGMNEGAWIGAIALAAAESRGVLADGLVVLDSSGIPPIESLRESLEELDESARTEAELIVKAILSGDEYPEPSGPLAEFFSGGRKEWLESWLRIDPPALLANLQCPVLFVIGQKDMQVDPESFERYLAARPGSPARIIPGMNYVLKEVGSEEDNFSAFTRPDFPVPAILVELMAAFAKAKPAPGGSIAYTREAMNPTPQNTAVQQSTIAQ